MIVNGFAVKTIVDLFFKEHLIPAVALFVWCHLLYVMFEGKVEFNEDFDTHIKDPERQVPVGMCLD